MFSKQVFNRLLQLNYRSIYCNYLNIERILINKTFPTHRFVSHVPEDNQRNELIIAEKIKDFANKAVLRSQERDYLQDIDLNDKELMDIIGERKINALSEEPDNEFLDEISPTLGRSFNLSYFANKSETLQMLIKLGVDLAFIEKRSIEIAEYILKLDFESEVKPYINFLVDNGVKPQDLGEFFTKNPFIFSQHLEDLQIRVNYLMSKKLTKEMIASVVTKAPKFLNFSTKSIDYRLGLLHKDFHLSADEVRLVLVTYPRTALMHHLAFQEILFIFKEEFGFNMKEIKQMLIKHPKLIKKAVTHKKGHSLCVKLFDFVHNEMKISHELIAKNPHILDRDLSDIINRHFYLKKLGRNQYDPKKPLYVPLLAFYTLEDNEFCEKYAKTSVKDFNLFMKTQ